MKKYFVYLIFYSVGGFALERIINLIFYGEWIDNSVLVGPYQPLYGIGVLLTIIFYDYFLKKLEYNKIVKKVTLLIAAIFFTGLVEATTGYGYEALFGTILWDYGEFLPCSLTYICIIPTSLFGFLSFLAVIYIHPIIKGRLDLVNKWLVQLLFIVFMVDIIYTLIKLFSI